MRELVVIASLGRVRPLMLRRDEEDPTQRLHLIEEPDRVVEFNTEHRSDVVSDQSGRFSQNAARGFGGGMSYGEKGNWEVERERQALHQVANEIGRIVAAEGNRSWRLMVPQAIASRLRQAIPPAARESLVDIESGDYTKVPLAELEKRLLSHL